MPSHTLLCVIDKFAGCFLFVNSLRRYIETFRDHVNRELVIFLVPPAFPPRVVHIWNSTRSDARYRHVTLPFSPTDTANPRTIPRLRRLASVLVETPSHI